MVEHSCFVMVDKDGKYIEADMSRDLNNVLGNIHENSERLEEK
nr:MAG TPA: YopX protein [Caudoviricetes sp.]